jgi:hypothetical protein
MYGKMPCMNRETSPQYVQAAMFPHALTLEAFRQTLPENERYETFGFFLVQWDIAIARYRIQSPGKRLDVLPVTGAVKAYGLDQPQTMDSFARVDEARATSDEIDTKILVIQALQQGDQGAKPKPILIDVLHLLYKEYREGKEKIPYYALTPEEERQCRI